MKDHHRYQPEARRIWITDEQKKTLLSLGYPKDVVVEMNYREAERIINEGEQLPQAVIDWELRFSMPDLKGITDTQSAYARKCRYGYLISVPYVFERLLAYQQTILTETLSKLKFVREATYWINKRGASLYDDFHQYLTNPRAMQDKSVRGRSKSNES